MSEIRIVISPDGRLVRAIYNDNLRELFNKLGLAQTHRASHVEPDENNNWIADCSPIGGPKLGPFERREDALTAEVTYINTKGLFQMTSPDTSPSNGDK